MRWFLAFLLILTLFSAAFANLTVTGVDVNEYPTVKVLANFDVPDPERASFSVCEGGECYPGSLSDVKSLETKPKVDFVVVFDITGSMDDEIEGMKRKIKEFATMVKNAGFDYRFSLVTFKDAVVKGDYGFTSDVEEFKSWLSRLSANGGGDTPEAALDALMYAMRLSARRDAQKVAILITDAPYHYRGDGTRYSKYIPEDVRRFAEKFGYTIYAISPKTEAYKKLVRGIGRIFNIKNPSGMEGILDSIAKAFTSQIVVVYKTKERDGGEKVRFTIKADYDGERGARVFTADGEYEVPPRPKIDMKDFTIVAEGMAMVDPNLPEAQAILMAKDGAILDAKRIILSAIENVKISAELTFKDMILTSEDVETEVHGLLRGAEVIDEKYDEFFGTYTVKLKASFRAVYDPILHKTVYLPKWDKGIVVAKGVAAVDKSRKPIARAVLMARAGAIALAQKNLLEAVKGIHIDAHTTVKDKITESDVVRAKLVGVIRGAVIIDEMKYHVKNLQEAFDRGYYWVEMAIPISEEGRKYLTKKYDAMVQSTIGEVVIGKKGSVEPSRPSPAKKHDYLIVNASGMKILVTLKGYSIYSKEGKLVLDRSAIKAAPAMEYSPTLENARSKGKGIIVKALKVEGESIYLDKDYDTLKEILVDEGLGESGRVIIVGDFYKKSER